MEISRNFWKIAGSIVLISALLYFLVKSGGDFSWEQVAQSAKSVGILSFLWALVWVWLQTACQILRLWFLLPRDGKRSLGLVAYAFSVGQWLNSFVPARAGDVVKALIVSHQSAEGDLARNAGVVVADKIVDLFSLFTLVLFAGGLSQMTTLIGTTRSGSGVIVVALAILILVVFRQRIYTRWPALLKFESGFHCLSDAKRSIPAWMASQGSWAFEAVAISILVAATGGELSFHEAVFCLFVLNLAIAVPVSVANVGTFEASLVFALNRFGLTASSALAVAVLHHLLQWIGISVWALSTWLIRRRAVPHHQFRVRLTDKMRAVEYYGKMAAQYDEAVNRGLLRRFRERERNQMLRFADLNHPAQSMIDVGCGQGFYALRAKESGMVVTAVDASSDMVERLSGKVDKALIGDIDNLTLFGTFDCVVCAGVLDFVRTPAIAFRNLARLVSPGGRLIILSPRMGLGGLWYRIEKRIVGIRVNLYSLEWFEAQTKENGLALIDYSYPLVTNMAVLFERPRR